MKKVITIEEAATLISKGRKVFADKGYVVKRVSNDLTCVRYNLHGQLIWRAASECVLYVLRPTEDQRREKNKNARLLRLSRQKAMSVSPTGSIKGVNT